MKKVIHYVNQFFGQIGGEDKADFEPEIREGAVGPGILLNNLLSPVAEVTHTIICGDNFFGSRKEEAIERILNFLVDKEFDLFIAGPAFMAGRYGVACGGICKAVKDKFKVPVITSMYVENPGVEMYRKEIYIFPGGNNALSMRKDVPKIAAFAKKILSGESNLPAEQEGYIPRGIRLEAFKEPPISGADRAVDMLLKKLNGEEFKTEMPMPVIDRVPIANRVSDLREATIALVTSGGIVPRGNPDRIQSASATKWGKYDISKLDALKAGEWETIHAGFDPSAGNADPNRIVPLDALRYFEKEGKIGRIHEYLYSTVGTGTTQAEASRMGSEIAQHLKDANVSAVILTST
jgi:betaine reductase complex component B subunit beta